MTQRNIEMNDLSLTAAIFGEFDRNMEIIENEYGVTGRNLHDEIVVSGHDEEGVKKAAEVIGFLSKMAAVSGSLTEQNVRYVISMVNEGNTEGLLSFDSGCICISAKGKPIKPKTVGQKAYTEAIKKNSVVICTGPAGTGKTFLAVAMAVSALRQKQISKIVLTRPAVEAGERLGFLPGDLQSKIDPYLRPLYDALFEMLGAEVFQRNLEKGVIEVAPLAYMRGRTLDDAFIILDEAQNTTGEQMKMFLTRMGNNSKSVVCGDITQTDLEYGKKSGLLEAVKVLGGIDGICIYNLSKKDVVRHKLVQTIIDAYEKYESKQGK